MHEPGLAGHPRAEPAAWFGQGAAVLSFSIRPLVVRQRGSIRHKMGFFKRLFGVAMRHDSQFKRAPCFNRTHDLSTITPCNEVTETCWKSISFGISDPCAMQTTPFTHFLSSAAAGDPVVVGDEHRRRGSGSCPMRQTSFPVFKSSSEWMVNRSASNRFRVLSIWNAIRAIRCITATIAFFALPLRPRTA